MLKYFLATLLIVTLAVFTLIYRLGGFMNVDVEFKEEGPFQIAYQTHLGPYHTIVATIEAVEREVKSKGDPCRFSFGEYLDDPKTTAEDRLRSRGGCFVEANSSLLTNGMKTSGNVTEKSVTINANGDSAIKNTNLAGDDNSDLSGLANATSEEFLPTNARSKNIIPLKIKIIPRRLYLKLKFSGAPSIAPYKVYPKADQEALSRNLVRESSVIERYEVTSEKMGETTYFFPVKPRS
jgi:effector-binding domain-containing protein